jgi:hypothetical protein
MSLDGFNIGDKVKIKESTHGFTRGYTGKVVSLLFKKDEYNIGVDLEGDHFDPTPYYFNSNELEKLRG